MFSYPLDIPTIIIVIVISDIIQIAVLFDQYKSNPNYNGIGYWTISNFLLSLGFLANNLRVNPTHFSISITLDKIFFIAGMAFWLVGTCHFFGKKVRYVWLISFSAIIIVNIIVATYVFENYLIQRISLLVGVIVFSLSIAWNFYKNEIKSIRRSSTIIAILFLTTGLLSLAGLFTFIANGSLTAGDVISDINLYIYTFFSELVRTFGIVVLINQRLNADILHSLKNQEILFNTSPDSILLTRLSDGRFIMINEGFANMIGYTQNEVIDKTTLDLDIWAYPQDRIEFVNQLEKFGVVESKEYEFKKRDGTKISAMISARIIDYLDKPHILSVLHDITNLKLANQKFRILFELSPIGFSMVDNSTGKFLEVNESLLEMTGYTKEEFLKLTYWDITPPEYYDLEKKQIIDIQETGFFGPNEKQYFRKDGSRFDISISGVLLHDNKGQSINWGFIEDITERKKLQLDLKIQATTDELTGLYNRRHFLNLAQKEIKRSIRNFHPLTIAIFDLDRLKFFNDNFGHNFGDNALITFADQCKINLRDIDIFARYGGDEFVLLLPETSIEEAGIVVERIRKIINKSIIQVDAKSFNLSTSIGLATLEHQNDTLDEILARADAALYLAKEQGRNRVITKTDFKAHWPTKL